MQNRLIILFFLITYCLNLKAQEQYTQLVKGIVRDADSQKPLVGAAVKIEEPNYSNATTSDEQGNFKLNDVPIGRHDFTVSFIGYETFTLKNILVISGKELFLTIDLRESVEKLEEVVIKANRGNQKPLNEMATLSARSFSVEETKRYAGSFSDPARMAMNFAGVASGSDFSNEIVIRGNTPKGILWRIEGVEVPNPNHFGQLGSGGGGVSMLSAGTLSNSDFYTGAFPAEFGNALSGVFDLKFRNGNADRREYALQIGGLGMEVNTEGYFKKGGNASYLFNYRYSSTGFVALFIPFLKAFVPTYQDASFKINVPTEKAGTFGLFGLWGKNISEKTPEPDRTKWKNSNDDNGFDYNNSTGFVGLSHQYFLSDKTYIKSVLAYSLQKGLNDDYYLDLAKNYQKTTTGLSDLTGQELRLNTFFNHKFDSKNTLRIGGTFTKGDFDMNFTKNGGKFLNSKGGADMLQVYGQWKYRFADKWTLNSGLHFLKQYLSNKNNIEPRLALQWQQSPTQSFGVSVGLHSRPENISVNLLQNRDTNGVFSTPNRNIDIPKAVHYVLSYDKSFAENWRFKMEIYYQSLYDISVEKDSFSSLSLINEPNTWNLFNRKPFVGAGKSMNVGVDFTVEKSFSNDSYFMLTASIFDSKFKDYLGRSFNTFYNSKYLLNIVAGKDFKVGASKRNLLNINAKLALRGGNRFTPINEFLTRKNRYVILDNDRVFESQMPAYWRVDWSIQYKKNRKHSTQTIFLDVQNTFDNNNVLRPYFDFKSNTIQYEYQLGILPNMGYRIEF
jgi:hypothetical protein